MKKLLNKKAISILMAIYEALGASPAGNVAVKLSTGEPGSNYLRTDLIGELVQTTVSEKSGEKYQSHRIIFPHWYYSVGAVSEICSCGCYDRAVRWK